MKLLPVFGLIVAPVFLCVSCQTPVAESAKDHQHAAAAVAGTAAHDAVLHHHPVFSEATASYVLEDWKGDGTPGSDTVVGVVVVKWTAMEDISVQDKIGYRVDIFRSSADDDATYSLITLGIQSPRHEIEIVRHTGDVAVLLNPSVSTTNWVSPDTKIPSPSVAGAVVTDRIGFIRFNKKETSCTLYLHANNRKVFGPTMWSKSARSMAGGHYNEPPENPPR